MLPGATSSANHVLPLQKPIHIAMLPGAQQQQQNVRVEETLQDKQAKQLELQDKHAKQLQLLRQQQQLELHNVYQADF